MLPIINTAANFIPPTPLVNTVLPGSTITHVPYDNVAPSVSSAQTDPNARGNSYIPSPQVEQQGPITTTTNSPISSPVLNNTQNFNITAQATFLAQLMGQDVSIETQGILVQYEKLIALSNVKYKPSNALKPTIEPSSLFGRILHDEKPVARVVQQPISTLPPSNPVISTVVAITAKPVPSSLQKNAKISSRTSSDESKIQNDISRITLPKVASSYAASAARISLLAEKKVELA